MQFPERERPFLQRWRDLAIEKERQLSQRRTDQLRELQKYVVSRLSQIKVCDIVQWWAWSGNLKSYINYHL